MTLNNSPWKQLSYILPLYLPLLATCRGFEPN